MPIVLASQAGSEFDELAAAHPAVEAVIPLSLDDHILDHVTQQADALIVRPGPMWKAIAERGRPAQWPGRIRWVQSTSAGVDYYPGWLAEAPWFSCGRGVASDQIADYVVGAIYAHVKDFGQLSIRSREEWKPVAQRSVIGRTVAILGLGSIGRAIAARVRALGAIPIGVRRSPGVDEDVELVATLEDAVAIADDIVIALPATGETRGIVNAALLAKAKPGAHLINIARGSIVDQEALLAALDDGRIGFATLDVTDPEPLPAGHRLYAHPLVRITPHLSSNWQTVIPTLHRQLIENIEAVANDRAPANLVLAARGY
ncbi:MAG: NAD(P)-dependent oxidoreductase [Sphingobium sp.]